MNSPALTEAVHFLYTVKQQRTGKQFWKKLKPVSLKIWTELLLKMDTIMYKVGT